VRRLVYLASARRDLLEILEYITRESGSVAAGRSFVDQLRQQCSKLAALSGTLGRLARSCGPTSEAFRSKDT
jgi:hypothetical protein